MTVSLWLLLGGGIGYALRSLRLSSHDRVYGDDTHEAWAQAQTVGRVTVQEDE